MIVFFNGTTKLNEWEPLLKHKATGALSKGGIFTEGATKK